MTKPETYIGERSGAMRVWLLGGFLVSVGARTIVDGEWRLRKAASLVKLLALAPDHRLHREQAMELLWPHLGRGAASNNLRQVLHGARRILGTMNGSEFLASDGESLVLCPRSDLWVDADAFEDAATTARCAREPAAYRAAIDLYAGDLLPDDRYEAWAEDRREQLRQLYLAMLIGLAKLHEERDEYGPAIDALRKATDEEPTLEEAYAALMQLDALSGKPEQALTQYERLRSVLSRTLGQRPAEATVRLHDEIAAGRLTMTPPAGSHPQGEQPSTGNHNLPAPRTSFVGREPEMVEIKRAFAMTRLLTLTGAGGSGKTRLAMELARALAGTYHDGARMAELAPLSEPGLVPQEVAGALDVQERPEEVLSDTLTDALRDKELLLVLDNCEHVVGEVARLVDALLGSCPRLRVLATSREPLYLSGEVNWAMPPLSLPPEAKEETDGQPTADGLMRSEAVRLFVERARLRLPSFELTPQNAVAVASVCRKLDGIPLAIELATARMGTLAVEQVAQRLDVSLDVLKGASRSAAPRQRTLRATLDWSYDLLAGNERRLFGRLSVFSGGWTLEAAEAVCSGGGIEEEDILDLLGGLVDKSLVVAEAHAGGSVRYRMLEPIRQYALEQLGEGGQAEEVRGRHAACFLALAKEAEPELAGQTQGLWAERLEAEHDNMRVALSWQLEQGEAGSALRLVAGLWRYWHLRGHASEGVGWLERALAHDEQAASPSRTKALEGMGWLTQLQGDYDRARANYEEMLELSQEVDDKANVATALNSLGTVAAQQGDNGRARTLLEENLRVIEELQQEGDPATALKRFYACNLLGYLAIDEEGDHARGATLWEESLALAREVGDDHLIGMSLGFLAHLALMQRDYERAKVRSEEALGVARELAGTSAGFVPSAFINLGIAALGLGEQERAREAFERALLAGRDTGAKPRVIESLEGMASLAGAAGRADRVARLWGAAEAAREADGVALSPGERAMHEPYLDSARSRLGKAAWEEALAVGRSMSLEEAVEYARAKEEVDRPAVPVQEQIPAGEPVVELTPRENEIVALVARGLTNRQISTELSISERTAGNHVAKILRKLGLRSRAQIAAHAGSIVDAPGTVASDG
jgi:predicted ATPase/DNA-binding SARP family transcriptional activator/DNA-binding CsgD family transcriptional regulator